MTTTKGRDLADLAHKSGVAKQAARVQIVTKTGDELLEELPLRIGCRGDTGTGKTTMVIHMLNHQIIEAAEDDDHIRWMFAKEKPDLCEKLLATDNLDARRSYLRAAHKVFYLDFDKSGFQKLFRNLHHSLRNCVTYASVAVWEEAYAAKDEGISIMTEHAAEWGWKGCWFVIDNGKRAWQMTRDYYVRGITGMSNNDLMMEFNLKNPGRDSEAASKRAAEINNLMNYSVITPAHDDEWLYKMMDTGSNLLLLAPTITRKFKETDENGVTKEWEEVMIGGAPGNRFLMDILIRKWKSGDGKVYYARIEKVRGPEMTAKILSSLSSDIENPTFGRILKELNKMERLTIASNEDKHEHIDFFDKLPDLDNLPSTPKKPKKSPPPHQPPTNKKRDLSELKRPLPPPPRKKAPPPPPRKKTIEDEPQTTNYEMCGEVNPLTDSTCFLPKGHKETVHKADNEEWMPTSSEEYEDLIDSPGFDDAVDDFLEGKKQSDLKAEAKKRGLSYQGKKRAIAARIIEHDIKQSIDDEPKSGGIDIPKNPWSS